MYVRSQPRAEEFLDTYEALVSLLTDGFLHEDKRFLTIAIGCTGGQHRSVYIVERLAEHFSGRFDQVLHKHRELS